MAFRAVEINLISAHDLNDVNLFSKSKIYALALIQGSQRQDKRKTTPDKENGTNPNWNFKTTFMVEEAALLQGGLVLDVEIRTVGTLGDKEIGRVSVLLKEFVKLTEDGSLKAGAVEFVSYQVRKPSGKPKGTLNLSVKIGERTEGSKNLQPSAPMDYGKTAANGTGSGAFAYPPPPKNNGNEPVTAYPAYQPGPSSAYPPPPPPPYGAPYPPPPPHGAPYPPQYQGYPPQYQGYPQQGYPPQGYPPQYQGYPPQQPPKKSKFGGMGLGAGLLGGALGGLLIGDMIGDSGGFDGGFDDGGGFDF